MKVFVLGSSGMLGRYVSSYFTLKGFDVVKLDRSSLSVLHLREEELRSKFHHLKLKSGDVVINCIGMIKQRTDIDDVEFIYINSIFPRILANVCENENVKMIHPTSDCCFSGLKGSSYKENDLHDGTDVYGKTKSLGEPKNCCVIRTSIIGEEIGQSRSLVEWVKSNKDKTVNGYTNHIWNGVTCLQFSKICEEIINNDIFWKGVRHIFSNTLNKCELVKTISDVYDLNIKINEYETTIECDRSLSTIFIPYSVPSLKKQIQEMKDFKEFL